LLKVSCLSPGEWSTDWAAKSTMIALLGREAIYSGKEVTWKGELES